jgi:murein L,D-transpeptidase YcbB/YkuD
MSNGEKSGVFDRKCIAALKAFQTSSGIMPDGKAGSQTLILLYRAGNKFPVPILEKQEEHQDK